MGSTDRNIKILFFPLMAQGHMLPMIDMAKLFAARGATVAILTIPENAALIRPTIDRFNSSTSSSIQLHLIHFPSAAEESENISLVSSHAQFFDFVKTVDLLSEPFDVVLKNICPDCVVSDAFMPWTCEVAGRNGIPRISFLGSNFFASCAADSVERHQVLESLPQEEEAFALSGLPHHIKMLRSQLRDPSKLSASMAHVQKP